MRSPVMGVIVLQTSEDFKELKNSASSGSVADTMRDVKESGKLCEAATAPDDYAAAFGILATGSANKEAFAYTED